ncbi:hypothetical protein [Sphingomonas sp.]|uniref:hypothetical protein n=1 Tax=Sphingomonas sp. TaxID=28214 RepID=UPI002ED7BD0F
MRRNPGISMCDAPNCRERIPRGKLMCRAHWFRLPAPLRRAISDAWKEGRIRDWSANCLEARSFIAGVRREPQPETSPERAYELQARMLGERDA